MKSFPGMSSTWAFKWKQMRWHSLNGWIFFGRREQKKNLKYSAIWWLSWGRRALGTRTSYFGRRRETKTGRTLLTAHFNSEIDHINNPQIWIFFSIIYLMPGDALIYEILFLRPGAFFHEKYRFWRHTKIPQKLCRQKQNSDRFAEAFVISLIQ